MCQAGGPGHVPARPLGHQLLSLTATSQPDYLTTANLSYAILSFLSKVCHISAWYMQAGSALGAPAAVFLALSAHLYMAQGGPEAGRVWQPSEAVPAFHSSLAVVVLLGTSRSCIKLLHARWTC